MRSTSKPPIDRARALLALLVAALAVSAARGSSAENAARAHAFSIGAELPSASGETLDVSSTSVARSRFPRAPVVAFRARLPGGIGQAPASDGAGNLIVLHAEPRLSKLDAQGRTLWSRRIEAEAMSAPIITAGGAIAFIDLQGDARVFSASGADLGAHALPFSDLRRHALVAPLANGGLLAASGSEIVELDAHGAVVRQGHASAAIVALAQSGTSTLVVSDNGAIAEGRASGDFELVGSFAGVVTDRVAARNGKLIAVVDGHKLIAFELATRALHTLSNDFAVTLSGPPVAFPSGAFALVADGALVVTYAANGTEAQRVSLLDGAPFEPALRALRSARLIGDAAGAIAAVRSGSDARIVANDGRAVRLDDTACLDPFRPTPTRTGLALACRSGQLFFVSEGTP